MANFFGSWRIFARIYLAFFYPIAAEDPMIYDPPPTKAKATTITKSKDKVNEKKAVCAATKQAHMMEEEKKQHNKAKRMK
jgi:hypothetical protein